MDKQTKSEEIKNAIKQAKSTGQLCRTVAVNMIRFKGFNIAETADILCITETIIHAWLDIYDREGIVGLAEGTRPGRPPFVPPERLENLVADIKKLTVYEFMDLVEKKSGVRYSEPHARRLLVSFGFSIVKDAKLPDHIPPGENLELWEKVPKRKKAT